MESTSSSIGSREFSSTDLWKTGSSGDELADVPAAEWEASVREEMQEGFTKMAMEAMQAGADDQRVLTPLGIRDLLALDVAGDESTDSESEGVPTGLRGVLWTGTVGGDPTAQYRLGSSFELGLGGRKNPEKAVQWYRLAAEQGHVEAQSSLAGCLKNGHGVRKDPVEAVQWYRLAAEQGDACAQFLLGSCLEIGDGVAQDRDEATLWLQRAADQGHEGAAFVLAHRGDLGERD